MVGRVLFGSVILSLFQLLLKLNVQKNISTTCVTVDKFEVCNWNVDLRYSLPGTQRKCNYSRYLIWPETLVQL